MKRILAVAIFECNEVPENIDLDAFELAIKKRIQEKIDRFSVYVQDHNEKKEALPIFDLDCVMVGTAFTIHQKY